jgi:OOP family OmpA-OmpF porin
MRNSTTRARLVGTVTVAVLGATSLAGCDILAEPEPRPSCEWLTATDPVKDAGRTVILLDRSGSTRGSGGPDYAAALHDVVTTTVGTHDVVSVGTFDGSAASVRWTLDGAVTDRGRTNPELRRADDETATRCLLESLAEAGGDPASTPGSDIMGALGMGGQALRGATGAKKVLVATDGLSTTGCADLTRVSIGDHAMIDEISRLCASRAPKRNDLAGVAVTLLGVGHPAGAHPQPSTLQLDWLVALWSELCAGTAAMPCEVSTAPVAPADPAKEPPPDAPTDPAVSFPPPEQGVQQADGSTHYQLDSSVLFAPNESVISESGQVSLAAIAADIRETGAGAVTVDGYTEARASAEANRALAQERADAVRMLLAGQGVGHVTATGHAGTAPDCAPADRQCKRRVDIVATAPDR